MMGEEVIMHRAMTILGVWWFPQYRLAVNNMAHSHHVSNILKQAV